jgi:hypothetical protein
MRRNGDALTSLGTGAPASGSGVRGGASLAALRRLGRTVDGEREERRVIAQLAP